nr:hypothetical protein [Abyssogena phaseoliformis symbiont]
MFDIFISKMEAALHSKSLHTTGLAHTVVHGDSNYFNKTNSVNFVLNSDKGINA